MAITRFGSHDTSRPTRIQTVSPHNNLTSLEDVEHVLSVPSLQTLDLQSNKLNDANIIEVFSKMPDLRVLYLQVSKCLFACLKYKILRF